MAFFGTETPPKIGYSLSQMDEIAKSVIERHVTVPGVQPKLSLSLINSAKAKTDKRLTVIGAMGGQYIFKPPSDRFPEMPANEHVTMRMAEAVGIKTVPSSLIRLASGEISYICKRIDRTDSGEKIHMIDMFQITEAYDKYKSSLEKVGKALQRYSDNPLLDLIFYFEIVLFSFLTGNNDMHLKNFSMIKSSSKWLLSPVYDLLNVTIVMPEDSEESALTLCGKKSRLKRPDFEAFGNHLNLTEKQIQSAINRMFKNQRLMMNSLDNSFLTKKAKTDYKQLLEMRFKKLS